MNFTLSESEKTAIYELRKAVVDTYSTAGAATDNEGMLYRQLAQENVNGEIKAILGDERYYDYARAPTIAISGVWCRLRLRTMFTRCATPSRRNRSAFTWIVR